MSILDKRPLKVFLCHASTDKPKVRELYRYLKRRGINPWFDEEHLVGGQDWQVEIPKALTTSDAIIICLTKNSVDKEGYIQKEIKFALDKALEMPEGRIFLIPVKFEECEVPFSLSRYQWVDLTIESGYSKMMKALKFRASQLERSTVELSKKTVEEEKLALEKAAKEKSEHEAVEKVARDKAEQEATEKVRLKAEELARQKTTKEKAERDVAEKVAREKAERQAARRDVIKNLLLKLVPFLRIIGIVGIIIVLVWAGLWAFPKFIALIPTPQAAAVATQRRVVMVTSTNLPVSPTKTLKPNATPTPIETRTVVPTSLPAEITDDNGLKMVLVPAGPFIMGSNENKGSSNYPAHEVNIDSYYMDIYEVTNLAYKLCVKNGACELPDDTSTKYNKSKYANHPIVYIDWSKAKTYCEWRGARLPSEAEWEKAARGTDGRTYPWGEAGPNCGNVNYGGEGCIGDTMPVGSYESGKSPYGIHDMAGNAMEWVDGAVDSNLRGGSWKIKLDIVSYYLVASARYGADNSYFYGILDDSIGFRCARDAAP